MLFFLFKPTLFLFNQYVINKLNIPHVTFLSKTNVQLYYLFMNYDRDQ